MNSENLSIESSIEKAVRSVSSSLGSKLYSDTAQRRQATWDTQDGTIVYFRIEEILHYERSAASTAFQQAPHNLSLWPNCLLQSYRHMAD
jgi:hypothetical protein